MEINMPFKDLEKQKAYNKAYRQKAEVKAKKKAYEKTTKYKTWKKTYYEKSEIKARKLAYTQTTEYKAKIKAYQQRPEVKAARKARREKFKNEKNTIKANGEIMSKIEVGSYLPRNIIISDNPKATELLEEYYGHGLPDDAYVISREQANERYSKEYGEYQQDLEEDKETILISKDLADA